MKKGDNKPWFPVKKHGIGWGLPITWQGWLVLLIYILLSIVGVNIFTNSPAQVPFFIGYFIILTILFILICWKKGEKIDK